MELSLKALKDYGVAPCALCGEALRGTTLVLYNRPVHLHCALAENAALEHLTKELAL